MSPRTTTTTKTLQQLSINNSHHHRSRTTLSSASLSRTWLRALCAALTLLIMLLLLLLLLIFGVDPQSALDNADLLLLSKTDHDNHDNGDHDFALASYQSYGFFDDITTREWKLHQQRVRDVYPNTLGEISAAQLARQTNKIRASDFYQDYYEPEFACRHERRVGQRGDGGKWVCDPHRLMQQQQKGQNEKSDCLVYSVGSEGDASFERAVKTEIGQHCEIHTFDMGPYRRQVEASGSHFHQWGIAATSTLDGKSYTGPGLQQQRGQFKSLAETIRLLNHTGRTIDIFKMDCEQCEFSVFPAFFEAGVHLQQVLIELHAFRKPMPMPQTADFFSAMFDHGYVIFHKEVNIKHWVGEAIEYAFVKLRPEFFEGIPTTGKVPAHGNTARALATVSAKPERPIERHQQQR